MSMRRPTARSVASIIAAQLEIAVEHVVPTACLYVDLQALPLALVRASFALEEAFGVVIPDDALAKVRTVEDFMSLVAKHSPSGGSRSAPPEASRTVRRVRTRPPKRMRRGRWA